MPFGGFGSIANFGLARHPLVQYDSKLNRGLAKQNMDTQSKRHFLRTSEGFEVDVMIDATGEYYSNLRTKAPPGSTKWHYDRAMREVDIWLEDTFGRAPKKITCLKEAAPAAIHRPKSSKQRINAPRREPLAEQRKKKARKT